MFNSRGRWWGEKECGWGNRMQLLSHPASVWPQTSYWTSASFAFRICKTRITSASYVGWMICILSGQSPGTLTLKEFTDNPICVRTFKLSVTSIFWRMWEVIRNSVFRNHQNKKTNKKTTHLTGFCWHYKEHSNSFLHPYLEQYV